MKATKVKSIPGYEGLYEVTDKGEIISLCYRKGNRPAALRHNRSQFGVHSVILTKDGIRKRYSVARLVAEAFVPNPDPRKYTHVRPRNGDQNDLRAENLEWFVWGEHLEAPKAAPRDNVPTTSQEAKNLAIAHAARRTRVCACDEDGEVVATFRSIADAQRLTGSRNIAHALATGCRSAGYYWKYVDGGE